MSVRTTEQTGLRALGNGVTVGLECRHESQTLNGSARSAASGSRGLDTRAGFRISPNSLGGAPAEPNARRRLRLPLSRQFTRNVTKRRSSAGVLGASSVARSSARRTGGGLSFALTHALRRRWNVPIPRKNSDGNAASDYTGCAAANVSNATHLTSYSGTTETGTRATTLRVTSPSSAKDATPICTSRKAPGARAEHKSPKTDCDRSATESCRSWLHGHSVLFSLLIASDSQPTEAAHE